MTWAGVWAEVRKSVSLLVIAICTSVYLLATLLDLTGVMSTGRILSWVGLSYIGFAQHFLLYQPFTAPFVHLGVFNLVFNMLSVYWFGQTMEARLGKRRYIEMCVLCALTSMLGFLAFSWGTFAVGFGYSGVVFGLLTAMAIFHPDSIINFYGVFPLKMKYAVLVIGGVELMLTMGAGRGRGAHWTYLLGAPVAWWYLRMNGWQRVAAITARLVR